jgi:methylthioribulose-1-phosphate dehydratase
MHTGSNDFPDLAEALAQAANSFYQRGWVLGTAGNFSAVLARCPMRLVITATGLHKGGLQSKDFLIVDESGTPVAGIGKPSGEVLLHISLAELTKAAAVLHTHSVWATILSESYAASRGLELTGYEMLKGLAGITTHEHREWIPIIENTQNYSALAREMTNVLLENPLIHGILLRRHGLYTWGRDIWEARRHVEILEFLLEVAGRLDSHSER